MKRLDSELLATDSSFKIAVAAINDNGTLTDEEKMEEIDLLLNPVTYYGITFSDAQEITFSDNQQIKYEVY